MPRRPATDQARCPAIADGTAWREFCDELRVAGRILVRPGSPSDALDRAEGARYLTRLLGLALEQYVEHADPATPRLYRLSHATAKIGIDNPDSAYLNATISGAHTYRLRGRRGDEPYLSFGVYHGHYGSGGRMGCSGYLEGDDLVCAADGAFEIVLSREAQARNWLRAEPDARLLVVRRTHLDRARERPTTLTIERVGAGGPPAPLDPAALAGGLVAAARSVGGTASFFCEWAEDWAAHPNELRPLRDALKLGAHGDPNLFMIMGYWELGPDQALVLDVTPPRCPYWNLEICNHWLESLDYRHHTIHVNAHTAVAAADGSVRIVVAARDPGVPNWLDTAGHRRGTMGMRWAKAAAHPIPRTRVVECAEVARLPPR